ncbi:MAG: BT_3987 domain-containing protein [Bacteroidaceae bacterium]
MKSIRNYLYGIALAGSLCTVGACEEEVVLHTGDAGKLDMVDGLYGSVRSEAGAADPAELTVFGDTPATGHLYFELTQEAAQDVAVEFRIDKDALDAYNTAHGTAYTMYPAEKLRLSDGGKAIVAAGERRSASVGLTVEAGGTVGETYAVAVSASAGDAVAVSSSHACCIYLVKPRPAIPDARKGDVRTLCFVEVNDENILSMGEYTMKGSGKPFFDIVSIFAANINFDQETGRVHVYCNDQVSFLLKNADRFVRPLQAKGIRVNLSILGNHDEAGMGNLSPEAAADFAKELKAYMDIYGLDGVDFDDEYSAYNNDNPSPGLLPRSRENYCRLVYECRKAMPDKLIGVYEYRLVDAPNGTVEGKTAGELVDYICYGTYQRYVPGREENFDGLTRTKYGPYSLKINEEYAGGWTKFSSVTIADLKEKGYGLQVFYNPKPALYRYDRLFSAVSRTLFDDEVVWTGRYYTRTSDAPIDWQEPLAAHRR